jgi:hypothetical protein
MSILQFLQVLAEDGFCQWDHLLVPAFVTGFVAAEDEECFALRVEGVQDAVRLSLVLSTSLRFIPG